MTALERLHNLERRETRIMAAWGEVGPLQPRYRAYLLAHKRLAKLIKDVEYQAHLEEQDLLWPNGLPAHP